MKVLLIALVFLFSTTSFAQRNDNPAFFLSTLKKKLGIIIEAGQFKPGDRVADIGAGLGWFDAALGIHLDSLSFYLEEIDSTLINNKRFHEAIDVYTKKKGRPFTCTYTWVLGTEKKTNLPANSFDKILLIDTFHHIEHCDEMLRDMKSILKPGGQLIVNEPIARKTGDIYKGCHTRVYTPEEIISSFYANGFRLEKTYKTVKSSRNRVRVFVFVHS